MAPVEHEERVRLSRSRLWLRQRTFYEEKGIHAWRELVPWYATSNPGIADSYAQIVASFLAETVFEQERSRSGPCHIVELGAGSGRFSFYLLKRLTELARHRGWPEGAFVYVMTDLVQENLTFWEEHEAFTEYLDRGTLDFARFDLEKDQEIHLHRSGTTLRGDGETPVVFLANYILDTLVQDLFRITDGSLEEGLVRADPALGKFPPNQGLPLAAMDGGVVWRPVGAPAYENSGLEAVLDRYRMELRHRTLLFPVGAMEALDRLRAISRDRLLLLVTDKGFSRHFPCCDPPAEDLVFHGGCFSMMVNLHAVGRLFEEWGGDCQHQDSQESITTSAFWLGPHLGQSSATARAFLEYLGPLAPSRRLALFSVLRAGRFSCSLPELVSALAALRWDPHAFEACLDALVRHLPSVGQNRQLRHDLDDCLHAVAAQDYPLPGHPDTAMKIALCFQELGEYRKALAFYGKTLARGEGTSAPATRREDVLYNMALCHIWLRQEEPAMERLREVVALMPGHLLARGWLDRLREMAGTAG